MPFTGNEAAIGARRRIRQGIFRTIPTLNLPPKMNDQEPGVLAACVMRKLRREALRMRLLGGGLAGDGIAGIVSALVTIAYCVSFSALIFQGNLKAGLSLGLWGLLMGSAVIGLYVAVTTSLAPAAAGPDTPAVAVMSVLAATVAGHVMNAGGGAELAAIHALIGITLATAVTGLVLLLLGRFELGQLVRFVPYPVIGGFLGASGWLMMSGAVEVITGKAFFVTELGRSISGGDWLKVAIALGFAGAVLLARRRWASVFVLPLVFFGAAIILNLLLWVLGANGTGNSWFISGSATLQPWLPVAAISRSDIDWLVFLKVAAEIGAVAGVTLVALLLDVSSLEVARSKAADIDSEFRSNGIGNLLAAPLGGLSGNLSMQSSKLLEETGATSWAAGTISAAAIGLVLLTGVDLAGLVPIPLLAGLLIYLGLLILGEALLQPPAKRSWTDLALALLIMFAIVQFGYLVGVVLGFVGACLMFAFSYSRIGVIRRHLTRSQLSSNVERAPMMAKLLRDQGGRIHMFWLSGFIFFGSSNGVFERLRRQIEEQIDVPVRFIVLDFAGVSGFDTSAVLSLVKLRNFCDERRVTLVYAGLSVTMLLALEQAELFGGGLRHRAFPTRNEALEWCEDEVLADFEGASDPDAPEAFETWLARELGKSACKQLVDQYFMRRDLTRSTLLYEQGGPSDTIDLIATGRIAVSVLDENGRRLRIRRMSGQTVVGEMGFFRGLSRAASVSSEGGAVVYTIDRESFQRLMSEQPDLATAFLQFIIRALSDRVDYANQEIAALI